MGYAIVRGPRPVPANVGLRAAFGAGAAVQLNPPDDLAQPSSNVGTVSGASALPRWAAGYTFTREPCSCGVRRDICDGSTPHVPGRRIDPRQVKPFLVGCARDCSTWGWQAEDYATDATDSLDLVQYEQVGEELWTGSFSEANGYPNPYLADADDPDFVDLVDAAGGTVSDGFDYVEGLATLEDALAACHSGMGVIHAPVIMAARWSSRNLLFREGRRVFTLAGNQVVLEPGYPGTGPSRTVTDAATTSGDATVDSNDANFVAADAGASVTGEGIPDGTTILSVTDENTIELSDNATATATGVRLTITEANVDGSVWAYATGPVQIRMDLGPPTLTPPRDRFDQAVDRVNNDIAYVAERLATATWGCCHLGVRMVRCTECF